MGYTTGVEANDTTFNSSFPYVQAPWSGYGLCAGGSIVLSIKPNGGLNIGAPEIMMEAFPNPASTQNTIRIRVANKANVKLSIYDGNSKIIAVPLNTVKDKGLYDVPVDLTRFGSGVYYAVLANDNQTVQSIKIVVNK